MAGHLFGMNPYSKVYGANMRPIWGRQDPGGPHIGPMNLAIWEAITKTNGDMLSIGPLGTSFREKISQISQEHKSKSVFCKKMICSDINVLQIVIWHYFMNDNNLYFINQKYS